MKPVISIIMAVYNCEDTIKEAIDSIIFQTFKNWELIVCDDGSNDNTLKILNEYAKVNTNIKVLFNKSNKKLPYSLNKCLKYANGEYIARMDGDDLSASDRLEKQYNYLISHPEIDVVGTGMKVFDENGFYGVREPMLIPESSILGKGVPFYHATIMMKKDVYDKLNGYSLSKRAIRCEDVDLWFRFFSNGFVGENINEYLYYVREDKNALKRRNFLGSYNACRTLLYGYYTYKYPLKQYIYVLKPILSYLLPNKIKEIFHKNKWKNKKRIRINL